MGKADLHIHTTVSDGHSSPAEIVASALDHGLEIISITDHDTIEGVLRAQKEAKGTGLKVIPGVEITSDFNGREAHLLAYCFDVGSPEIKKLLLGHKRARNERCRWILDQLKKQGVSLEFEEVKAEANGSNIGRPHIASVLIEKGFVTSLQEAFIRYLGNQAIGPIKNSYRTVEEVIETVKKAGGAVIIAHPGKIYTDKELEHFVTLGIDGIEVLHPSHNYRLQKKLTAFADTHNLLVTGGSDFHGGTAGYQRHFGVMTLNIRRVEKMIRMTDQRKKISV